MTGPHHHLRPSADSLNKHDRARRTDEPETFLAFRGVDWPTVRRARFYAFQRFAYRYPSTVLDLSHRLMVRPPDLYGDQTLLGFQLGVLPRHVDRALRFDRHGNAAIELDAGYVRRGATFEATFLTERVAGVPAPVLNAREAEVYARPTRLTGLDDALREVSRRLLAASSTPAEFAQRVSDHVSGHMRYAGGVTHVGTNAATAYALGAGLCQDYAHISLALLREGGVRARYVSGHMPGEGSSHAWLEALIPQADHTYCPLPLDPTNARTPHLGYAIIAFGSDYSDVAPTAGVFRSSSAGVLTFEKVAGLTELEFMDGRVLRAGQPH